MGLAKQLFLLRRGGGTGACGRVEADIFGGKGGFTVFMLRSSRCKRREDEVQFSLSNFGHSSTFHINILFSNDSFVSGDDGTCHHTSNRRDSSHIAHI